MAKKFSQTSRDRNALNFFIAIPVLAMIVLIRIAKGPNPDAPSNTTP